MYKYVSISVVVLFFVSLVAYVFYYNPVEVTFYFGKDSSISLPLALMLIISFSAGAIFLSTIALLIGLKFKFREWNMARRMRQKDEHYVDLAKANDLLAIGDTEGARALLKKIVNSDPDDILSRIQLAQTFYKEGKTEKAISLLEEARSEQRRSPALLVAIAEAQKKAGNLTAAHDSILLALRDNPKNIMLLEEAVSLSRKLNKIGDARFLVEELLRVSPYIEQHRVSALSAEIEFDEINGIKSESPEEYSSRLSALLKNHKDFVPAILAQAEDYFEKLETEKAIKTLKKAFLKTGSSLILTRLVRFWLETENPAAALAILKESLDSDNPVYSAEFSIGRRALLLQVLLHLENIDDAKSEISRLENSLKNNSQGALLLNALRAKLESRTPGRGKTNVALESIIHEEAIRAGMPTLDFSLLGREGTRGINSSAVKSLANAGVG
ncbi:MAG TPA: hypothetical protein PKA63_11190 [Oligoflexia bacterium]|nr:hypothetical protein [Oligoflexia bacterium]HMP49223.1 hypothetical protein [Oligoflexia bacterium]